MPDAHHEHEHADGAGAFPLRSVLNPPWALSIRDEAPLTVLALVRARAWVAS